MQTNGVNISVWLSLKAVPEWLGVIRRWYQAAEGREPWGEAEEREPRKGAPVGDVGLILLQPPRSYEVCCSEPSL